MGIRSAKVSDVLREKPAGRRATGRILVLGSGGALGASGGVGGVVVMYLVIS